MSIKYGISCKELQELWNVVNLNDKYTKEILTKRYNMIKNMYIEEEKNIKQGLNIRHQNIPEDITENIVKFIIRKFEDKNCIWCKSTVNSGDLYLPISNTKIEVKSFTSNGPTQFGPKTEFDKLYFLDMRNWINDELILWKVNIDSKSDEFKNIKVNKNETIGSQFSLGRRPRNNWNNIYPQIQKYTEQIYKGKFEDIF